VEEKPAVKAQVKRAAVVSTAILKDHHLNCINKIRQVQNDTLGKFIRDFVSGNDKRATHLLLDPAYRGNLGNTLLTLREFAFFRRLDFPIEQRLYSGAKKEGLPKCLPQLHHKDRTGKLAFWHARGKWGDLYLGIQRGHRIPSIQLLLQKNFTVLSMPQSIF